MLILGSNEEENLLNKKRVYSYDSDFCMSEDEREQVVSLVIKHKDKFHATGFRRYRFQFDKLDNIPDVLKNLRKRIVEREDLSKYETDPTFGDSISYMVNGGELHPHKDPQHDGKEHVRFNVYVQLPEYGGRPIYAGVQHNLKERQYICCRSSIDLHSVTRCVGSRMRIMVSFGFIIPKEEIGEITYDYPEKEYKD